MKKAIWKKCDGEAHSNAHIDHCAVCMPWWESYPVCPDCGEKLRMTFNIGIAKCDKCKQSVDILVHGAVFSEKNQE